jgi:type VI secretion system secreted protein VgrG
VFEGKSNYPLMQPGFKFTLENHFRRRYNAEYLVTSVRHTGSHRGAVSPLAALSDGDEETYTNAFTCIPLGVPYRPPRLTPVPRMPAVTTARVETAGGKYAHVDEDGRYHAKMAYDRSDLTDGEASRPIRMSQPYSGAGYGMHFPNHAETELLVAHMNDDPDRPMALGTVPNPANASPVRATNKHEGVIRTQAGNEMVMDDTEGKQTIRLQTTARNRLILGDEYGFAGMMTTEGHEVQLQDKGKFIQIKTTGGHHLLFDDEKQGIKLWSTDGHMIEINDPAKTITIADASGSHTITIDATGGKVTVATTGDMNLHAPSGTLDIKATTINITSTGDTTMNAVNTKVIASGGLKMEGNTVLSQATTTHETKGANVSSDGATTHKTKAPTVTSEGTTKNEVKGALVDVTATGVTNVKGSMVNINS